jgi:general secretion pathway protein D
MTQFSLKQSLVRLLLIITLSSVSLSAQTEGETGFSFQDADIRVVIEAVSRLTGKNFIVDPRVKGKVTMISSSNLDEDALYEVFLEILKTHGFIAVPTRHNVVTILPEAESRTEGELTDGKDDISAGEIGVRIFEVQNGNAAEMVPILRPLVSRNGHIAAHGGSNNIIISDTRRNIDKIEHLIHKMDVGGQEKLRLFTLSHAVAIELLPVLKPVLAQGKTGAKGVNSRSSIVADERTNSLLVRAGPVELEEVERMINRLDQPLRDEGMGETAVIKLRYASAKNVVEIINKMLGNAAKKDSIIFDSDALPQVSMDEKANSVIVVGSARYVKKLVKLIHVIDVKRTQVMVEALIVEISATKAKQLGIQWRMVASGYGVTSSSIGVDSASVGQLVGEIKSGNYVSFGVLAEALATDADTNLISTPSVMTMENEEAEIEVGQEVPFVTGSYTNTSSSSTSSPFQTITRENVGLKLKITPQINQDDVIHLKVEQEFSSVDPTAKSTLGAVDIVTKKRVVKTNVLVNNGRILVLGGLIQDNVTEARNRVPGVSKIPLFGRLFRHRETNKEKSNLMVFIRPLIVDNQYSAREVTRRRYNYIRNEQLDRAAGGVMMMPEEEHPVLEDVFGQSKPRRKPVRRPLPPRNVTVVPPRNATPAMQDYQRSEPNIFDDYYGSRSGKKKRSSSREYKGL